MPSFDRVIELVNEKNDPTYPLTPDVVSLNDVVAETSNTHNTRVTMRARPHETDGYSGQVDLYYTRALLTALGELSFRREQPFTYDELFALICQTKIAHMGPEDFTNDGLPPMTNGQVIRFILSARDNSLGWLGNTQVTLLQGIPDKAEEFNAFWDNEVGQIFA